MALRGEVDDRVEPMLGEQLIDQRAVADVALDEAGVGHAVQAGAVARIGQRVQHHDHVVGAGGAAVADVIAADETGAAGDEHPSHGSRFP